MGKKETETYKNSSSLASVRKFGELKRLRVNLIENSSKWENVRSSRGGTGARKTKDLKMTESFFKLLFQVITDLLQPLKLD